MAGLPGSPVSVQRALKVARFAQHMSRFKSQSEEKMADLDHETNNRRGGGYAPRSRRGR